MQLNYKGFGAGEPVVVLHGLFGSLDNWQTIAKKLAEQFNVYILDQRNHGRSPHSAEFSYQLLADDLSEFFKEHNLSKAHLIGHSMGGKAAMQFALDYPEMVMKLVVVDTSPAAYENRHASVFDALFAVDVKQSTSRQEVEQTLREKLRDDEATIQFLMKGLQRAENAGDGFQWKFNIESLHSNYDKISGAVTASHSFQGETLFLKGEKSSYISPENYGSIQKLFPNHQLTEIKGAGHWIHADKPQEFIEQIRLFLTAQ